MLKINHESAKKKLKIADKYELNVCFVGRIGVGKTQLVEEYAAEEGKTLHTLTLSALDPAETLGMPSKEYVEIDGTRYAALEPILPSWAVKAAREEKPVLFVDEVFTARPEVAVSFLNFFTTKKIGDLDLSHMQIIAATNVERDSISYPLLKNFLDRLCFFELEFNEQSFGKYMKKRGELVLATSIIPKFDISVGSKLYETRDLSPRNFEKVNKIAAEEGIQVALEFIEGYTNLRMSSNQVRRLKGLISDNLRAQMNMIGVRSARLHNAVSVMVESTARSIFQSGEDIPDNFPNRISSSFYAVTKKEATKEIVEEIITLVEEMIEDLR